MEKQTKKAEMPTIKPSKEELLTLVKGKDGKVRIAMGNFQISKREFKSFQAADDYIAQKPFEILVNVTCLIAENFLQNENYKKNPKNA